MSEPSSKRLKSSSSEQEDEDSVRSITPTPGRTAVHYGDASPTERLAHHQPRLPRGPPEQPLHIWRESDLQDDSTTSGSSPAAKDESSDPNSPQQPPSWQPPSHTVGQQGLHNLEDPFAEENLRNTQPQPSKGYGPNAVPRIAVGNHGTLPPHWIIEADTEPAQPRELTPSPVRMELFIRSQFDAWIHVDLPRHVYNVWGYQPSPPREIASPRLRWRFDPGPGHDDRWHDPQWRQYAWEVLRVSLYDPLTRETLKRELIASTLFEHVRDISNPLPHLPPQPEPQPPPRPRTPERAAVRPEGAVSGWTTSEETDETEADENEFDANNHGKYTTDGSEYEREPPTSMLYANARTAEPTTPGGRAFKAVMHMFGSGILSGPSRVTQQPVASHSQPIVSDSSGSPAYGEEDERWKEIYRPRLRGLGDYFDPEEDHQRELEEQALAEERGHMEPVGGKYRALWSVIVSSFVGMFVCLLLYTFGIIK
ncbi:hypothetical protein VTN00DRAFT_1612 [Thermoascus crustaceus]|uniref:uncharacterized protein n=1 Tax=Thermoascus crustaceus TaxID=5088 RepID=UPI0037433569